MEKIWLKNYPENIPAEVDITAYTSLVDLFSQRCEEYGKKPAFCNFATNLTFQEIDRLSMSFAAYCQQRLGLKKGDRVAIMLPNVLQYPVVLFGALRAGLIVVNVNPLYTAKELVYLLKDSGADTIIVLANFAHTLQEALLETPIKNIIVTNIGDLFPSIKRWTFNFVVKYIKKKVPAWSIAGAFDFKQLMAEGRQSDFQPVNIIQDDVAFLQYTGGTTGVSKGAVLSHGNILANVLQLMAWFEPFREKVSNDVVITALPLYHIFSLTVNCLTFFALGAYNILVTNPRDISAFVQLLNKVKFTALTGVNTLFNALLHSPKFKDINFTPTCFTFAGGMAIQKAVAQEWHNVTGSSIIEGYGLTEASPVVTANPFDLKEFNGSIGMPLPSTDIKVLDENEQEVAIGTPGELCVKGPQVMQGYWRDPDLTRKAFTQDGWLKTGDIVTVDDEGFLRIVDRKKDVIIVSGFSVYPNEVEDVMVHHPGIREAAVIGVPCEKTGELVKAFVVKKNLELSEEMIIKHCHHSLTHYKIPTQIEFRDELPKNNVGKILRQKLREEQ